MNDTNLLENQPIAWTPTEDVIERAQLTRFMRQIDVSTFDELYQFSINETEKFTAEVLRFLDIKFNPPYEKLLDTSGDAAFPQWCVGAGLNVVSHCVDRWQGEETRDQPAIIWEGEEGESETLTYAELFEQIKFCSAGLRVEGFGKGDAIGIHLPMITETIIALLAINRIGAIAVPVFSGYGVEAVASRMESVGAKAIFVCNGFFRRGKKIDAFNVALETVAKCPAIEKVFIVNSLREFQIKDKRERMAKAEELKAEVEALKSKIKYVKPDNPLSRATGAYATGGGAVSDVKMKFPPPKFRIEHWHILLEKGKAETEMLSHPEPTLAEDPLIILYTSGTTGKPKGIAHTHCSFPIKAAQDMAFGTDVGRGTRISWITDIGWMMGPWLIYGALINGATICIYDGAPDYPAPDTMWEFCAKHKVEILGISPTLVRALATHGDDLPKRHDLSSLRAFASTGEPWNPAPWWWLFEKVGASKLPIINYSGGTEISGGILMNNPLVPIKPCGFSAPCPGIDADILDDKGESVGANQVGELAIKKPWIGMARGFWQERERYLETYWSRFENIWVHGDWAMRDADGHWFILGRSDDTLKVAGKRVGPAEVESLLVAHQSVAEAAVIGVPDEMKGTAMVAFCVLKSDASDDFEKELKNLVAKDMGKPLAPSKIHFVSALPKTRNAKVMRRVIRSAYLGEDAGDLSALENPDSVEEIKFLL
ncbi:MAG: AMP-binding protein [Acidobacteriota bacterium]|nr:AMP-binding protein [Acidobacteriota bacterium]